MHSFCLLLLPGFVMCLEVMQRNIIWVSCSPSFLLMCIHSTFSASAAYFKCNCSYYAVLATSEAVLARYNLCCIFMGSGLQDILWQIVDETLRRLRLQFFADLDAYWDARTIYHAQVQAQQVPDTAPCTQSTAQHSIAAVSATSSNCTACQACSSG